MSCRKVKKLLPLFVGGDLSDKKSGRVRLHLDSCDTCRTDYEAWLLSYRTAREWLAEDMLVWDEVDWRRALDRAVGRRRDNPAVLALWPFRKVWAFALMALVAAGLSWVLVRPAARWHFGPESMTLASADARPAEQDVLSMTMVSQETGLKIVWFFDKKFDLEDKQQ